MDQPPTKIAIITRSLANGGVERFSALLSKILSGLGYKIHIVSVLDEIEYEYEGELFNLGLMKNLDNSTLGRFKRSLALKKYLNQQRFDVIIDNRNRHSSWSEWMIAKWIYDPKKTIYMVHSYKTDNYFPNNNFVARRVYNDASHIVAVSNEINELIQKRYGYQNTTTVYNPVDAPKLSTSAAEFDIHEKYILAYGRIDDDVKNYSLLIDGYARSVLAASDIKLYIIGDGKDVDILKEKAAKLHLSDKIIFKPKLANPFPYVKSALFTALTSRVEGFPMVIIESLALGTPVLAVDCHSGPREIILHEYNGLLVENDNVDALTGAMNRLVEDQKLYQTLKANAAPSVEHLSVEAISKKWSEVLKMGK